MGLPDEDVVATYTSNTENIKTDSDIKAKEGTVTRKTADEPIIFVADDGVVMPLRTTTQRDAISDPQDGAIIFNTTDNELQYYHSAQWNGSTYGNMYQVNNVAATTINTIDVFEDVLNFVTGEIKEITFASDALTTPSDETNAYLINYTACIDGLTNTTYEMAIEVDGTVRDESHSCATIATGGKDVGLSGGFILTIGASKDIKLVIANKTGTNNIIVVDASVTMTRIR